MVCQLFFHWGFNRFDLSTIVGIRCPYSLPYLKGLRLSDQWNHPIFTILHSSSPLQVVLALGILCTSGEIVVMVFVSFTLDWVQKEKRETSLRTLTSDNGSGSTFGLPLPQDPLSQTSPVRGYYTSVRPLYVLYVDSCLFTLSVVSLSVVLVVWCVTCRGGLARRHYKHVVCVRRTLTSLWILCWTESYSQSISIKGLFPLLHTIRV